MPGSRTSACGTSQSESRSSHLAPPQADPEEALSARHALRSRVRPSTPALELVLSPLRGRDAAHLQARQAGRHRLLVAQPATAQAGDGMKRSPSPRTRTPMRRARMKPGAQALHRGAAIRRRRLRRVSAKRRRETPLYRAFVVALMAGKPECGRCRSGGPRDPHHTRKPRASFLTDWNSVVPLCRHCHDLCDAPFARGRLVVVGRGNRWFEFWLCFSKGSAQMVRARATTTTDFYQEAHRA